MDTKVANHIVQSITLLITITFVKHDIAELPNG